MFPIEQLSGDEIAIEARRLQNSIAEYAMLPRQGWQATLAGLSPFRSEQVRENSRARASWRAHACDADFIVQAIRDFEHVETYRYAHLGVTVALMTLCPNPRTKIMHISWLVAHPGARGAAKMLIEKAVSLSQQQGFRGAVSVDSLTYESTQHFKQLGFEQRSAMLLMLRPDRNPKWNNDRGMLRLNARN